MFGNLLKKMRLLRSLLPSIYFNFHYLPFAQAIRLPILFYKPRFGALKGRVRIEGPVKTGMILLGNQRTGIYPDTGIMFENGGGECVFRGKLRIGGCSAISIGQHGRLEIGDDVVSNAALKLICFHGITIENRVRLGWETILMDTGFHRLKNLDGSFCGKGVARESVNSTKHRRRSGSFEAQARDILAWWRVALRYMARRARSI